MAWQWGGVTGNPGIGTPFEASIRTEGVISFRIRFWATRFGQGGECRESSANCWCCSQVAPGELPTSRRALGRLYRVPSSIRGGQIV